MKSKLLSVFFNGRLSHLFIQNFVPSVGTENEAKLVEESIQHAKEAVTLDVKDGNSWCKITHQSML